MSMRIEATRIFSGKTYLMTKGQENHVAGQANDWLKGLGADHFLEMNGHIAHQIHLQMFSDKSLVQNLENLAGLGQVLGKEAVAVVAELVEMLDLKAAVAATKKEEIFALLKEAVVILDHPSYWTWSELIKRFYPTDQMVEKIAQVVIKKFGVAE